MLILLFIKFKKLKMNTKKLPFYKTVQPIFLYYPLFKFHDIDIGNNLLAYQKKYEIY